MRCVVLGSGGQLGRCLVDSIQAAPEHELLWSADHEGFDLEDPSTPTRLFDFERAAESDIVFNAAAHTAVDRCESEEERALQINGHAPKALAARCRDAGVRLVHVSTDYVFTGGAPGTLDEASEPAPLSAYGRTKLAGERGVLSEDPNALVVRTSWVFGPGRNFVGAIIDQARARRAGTASGPLSVVDDQTGSPTYAGHLASGLLELAGKCNRGAPAGLYHLAGAGETSWWGFAREILDRTGNADLAIDAAHTGDLKQAAKRPTRVVLDTDRAAKQGVRLPEWSIGLRDYLASPSGRAHQEGP